MACEFNSIDCGFCIYCDAGKRCPKKNINYSLNGAVFNLRDASNNKIAIECGAHNNNCLLLSLSHVFSPISKLDFNVLRSKVGKNPVRGVYPYMDFVDIRQYLSDQMLLPNVVVVTMDAARKRTRIELYVGSYTFKTVYVINIGGHFNALDIEDLCDLNPYINSSYHRYIANISNSIKQL